MDFNAVIAIINHEAVHAYENGQASLEAGLTDAARRHFTMASTYAALVNKLYEENTKILRAEQATRVNHNTGLANEGE